jgi:hypothetical protein
LPRILSPPVLLKTIGKYLRAYHHPFIIKLAMKIIFTVGSGEKPVMRNILAFTTDLIQGLAMKI